MSTPILIGTGAYANIYSDSGSNAVKVSPAEHFDSSIREIIFINACDHPNIIKINHVEYLDDETQIYMDRYECNLQTYLQEHHPLPVSHILAFANNLLSALAHLYNRRIIHGDIKPQNILVDTDIPRLVLCDFNIATTMNERYHTQNVQTSNYRAPEINVYNKLGSHSAAIDMWSAGCVLFELITGCPLISPQHDVEDPTIYACELFELVSAGTRRARKSVLAAVTVEYILDCLRARLVKCGTVSGAMIQDINDSRLLTVIAKCLHPVAHKRPIAIHALYMIYNLPTSPYDMFARPIRKYSAAFIDGMNKKVVNAVTTACLCLGDSLWKCCDTDDLSVRYTCLYIATLAFSSLYAPRSIIKKLNGEDTTLQLARQMMVEIEGKIM